MRNFFQGWRWYEHEYHPTHVYHGMPLTKKTPIQNAACHCSKNPRRQQEHLDGVMLMVAWYVGVLRAFFPGKALGTLSFVVASLNRFFQTNYQWNGLRFSCCSSLHVFVKSFFGMAREGCKLDCNPICNSSCRIACCFEFSTLSFCRSVCLLKQRSKYLPQ